MILNKQLAYSATYLPTTLEILKNLVKNPLFLLNSDNVINDENHDQIKKKVKREELLDKIGSNKYIA